MKDVHTLNRLEQLKALADPLRLRVLETFAQQPITTKQVAALLGENATKLYHHVQILEEAGLVRLVKTRKNRGTLEKYYRAIARDFVVDRNLLELTRGPNRATKDYRSLFVSALEATLAEGRKSVAAGLIKSMKEGRNALVYRRHFCGSEAKIKELMGKVQGWIAECQAAKDQEGGARYAVTIAFYPVRKKSAARSDARKRRSPKRSRS
jgi:DNA-binding transcriptional ArsR family regulator